MGTAGERVFPDCRQEVTVGDSISVSPFAAVPCVGWKLYQGDYYATTGEQSGGRNRLGYTHAVLAGVAGWFGGNRREGVVCENRVLKARWVSLQQ